MNQKLMDLVEQSSLKAEKPQFEIGDTVDVHVRILEGEKERQIASELGATVVINDDLERATDEISALIIAQR